MEISNLPPYLKDVHDRFMANLAGGGVQACENMVSDLTTEAELTGIMSDTSNDIAGETIANQDELLPEQVREALEVTESVTRDHITAVSRRSFALFLLNAVKPPETAE